MENNNSAVGVYVNHEHAIIALKQLVKGGLNKNKISIFGKADIIDGHVSTFSDPRDVSAPIKFGAVAGPILGVLAGIGITAVPGFGMIYGAGALIGAIGGFDLGIIGGGLFSLLLTVGLTKKDIEAYQDHMEKGKHLLIFHGSKEEVSKARKIMDKGTAIKVGAHYLN